MFILASPFVFRLSLLSAGLALGRRKIGFKDVWLKTRGYTTTLWWMTLRAFVPIALFNYIFRQLWLATIDKMAVNLYLKVFMLEFVMGLLNLFMIALIVAANAEAFRIIIGVRASDAPHRRQVGRGR